MEETTHKHLKSDNHSFTIQQVYAGGWDLVKKNWATLLGLGAVMLLVELCYGTYSEYMSKAFADQDFVLWILYASSTLVYYVVYFWVAYNLIRILLNLSRGQTETVRNIFEYNKDTAKRAANFFLANILYTVAIFAGLILLIIPGIYLAMRFQFVQYLIVDKNMGVFDAFKKSSEMTKGEIWHLLGLNVVFILTCLLGLLALLIGIIPAVMLVTMTHVFAYNVILNKKLSDK